MRIYFVPFRKLRNNPDFQKASCVAGVEIANPETELAAREIPPSRGFAIMTNLEDLNLKEFVKNWRMYFLRIKQSIV